MNQPQNFTRDDLRQRIAMLIQVVENMQAPFPLKPITGEWLAPSGNTVENGELARRRHEESEIEALRGQVIEFLEEFDRYLNDYGTNDDKKCFHENALVTIDQAERGTYRKKSLVADLNSLKLLLHGAAKRERGPIHTVQASDLCVDILRSSEDSSQSLETEGETGTSVNQVGEVSAEFDPEELLKGKMAVNFQAAAQYIGVSDRQIRNLVKQGKLDVVGGGQQRKITTASLRRRKGESPLK